MPQPSFELSSEDQDLPISDDRNGILPREESKVRIDTIRNLHYFASNDAGSFRLGDNVYNRRLEELEFKEENAPPYMPTLGIEIEVFEKSLRPSNMGDEEWEEHRLKLLEGFEETERAGLPRGGDAFWEFANKPVRYYGTLSREVQTLVAASLINPDFKRHPMHLTVGGIYSTGKKGHEAYVLSRALEATGWSTTGWRLLKPLKSDSWTAKGENGLLERYYSEGNYAVEIRTLQFQDQSGLDRTLRSAYFLGAALKAFQKEPDDRDDVEKELTEIWHQFSMELGAIFRNHGIEDPAFQWEGSYWGKVSEPLTAMAKLMKQGVEDPESFGADFMGQVQELVIKNRAAAKQAIKDSVVMA
jgi:hypothetical protein